MLRMIGNFIESREIVSISWLIVDRKKHYDDMYSRHHDNNDVSATYKAAKNQAGITKNMSPTSFLIGGNKITDPQTMANIQSDTFP